MKSMFSPLIGKLAEALSKAQAEMPDAYKDSRNPVFSSRYSSFASLRDACREPLAKNGLAISFCLETKDSSVVINTLLFHTSGEWISSELAITPAKKIKKEFLKDAFQPDMLPTIEATAVAAAVQNGKRISLAAILGLSTTDEETETLTVQPSEFKNSLKQQPAATQSQAQDATSSPSSNITDKAIRIRKQISDRLGESYTGNSEIMDKYLHTIFVDGNPCSLASLGTDNIQFLAKLFNAIMSKPPEKNSVNHQPPATQTQSPVQNSTSLHPTNPEVAKAAQVIVVHPADKATHLRKQISDRLGEMYAGDLEMIDRYLNLVTIDENPCSLDSIETDNVSFLSKLFNAILEDYTDFKKINK